MALETAFDLDLLTPEQCLAVPEDTVCIMLRPGHDNPMWYIWDGYRSSEGRLYIDATTHQGASALAYMAARLLGLSDEQSMGVAWVGYGDDGDGQHLSLSSRSGLVMDVGWVGAPDDWDNTVIPLLAELPDTLEGRAAAIVAVVKYLLEAA